MILKRLILAAVLCLLFVACSDDSSSASSPSFDDTEVLFEDDSLHSGFVRVFAKGHYTYLGTNKSNVPVKERNSMKVRFGYDFSIAQHEITRQEYAEVMGGGAPEGEENLPIANLTYGDVVRYANAKSKQEGFDTVYSYSSVVFDAVGHAIGFEKLNFNAEIAGYRLPTEAEWVFAASRGWNPSESWSADESDKVQTVCTKGKNTLGLCDMAGNLAEWVNDWAGCFKDTTIMNFVGAPDGGAGGERVVKGGSYVNSSSNMNLYSRGATYTITTSSHEDYVGARLAFGPIDSPNWMNGCGSAESTVRSIANSSVIREKLGTRRGKLAFVNKVSGNLSYVNYNENNYTVKEIADTIQARHPDISPDGEWVAFSTAEEGVNVKSELYVCKLDAHGTDLVKLDVESAAIPRFDISPEGDTVIVYVDNSGNNKDSETFAKTSTWQVPFSKGKFGTPKKLFDGAYHGGLSSDRRLAVSGARILRARIAEKSGTVLDKSAKDEVWYNEEQACNVSLASDGSNRTMFLDFASSTGVEFVGKDYGVHERILIADSMGRLVQSVPAPDKYSFDHVEWVRNRNHAVSTLADVNGVHSRVVLVDLKDSSVTDLVRGDELMHPCFWVKDVPLPEEESFLDVDSAGVYMAPFAAPATVIMRIKMEMFWEYKDYTEVAIIGSSRSYSGVDPEEIKSLFAVNYAYAAEDLTATQYFIQNYFLPSMPKLKAIVLALDYDRLWIDGENWKNWFGDIPGYRYDENHDFWKEGAPQSMLELTRNSLSPSEDDYFLSSYHRGLYHSLSEGYSEETPDLSKGKDWFENYPEEYSYNLELLENILKLSQEKNVQVVGVVFPQSPLYKTVLDVWGRYGLSFQEAKRIQEDVEQLSKKYENFTIMDEYKNGSNDYEPDDFSNDDHLGLKGAVKLTKRLDSLLMKLQEK